MTSFTSKSLLLAFLISLCACNSKLPKIDGDLRTIQASDAATLDSPEAQKIRDFFESIGGVYDMSGTPGCERLDIDRNVFDAGDPRLQIINVNIGDSEGAQGATHLNPGPYDRNGNGCEFDGEFKLKCKMRFADTSAGMFGSAVKVAAVFTKASNGNLQSVELDQNKQPAIKINCQKK